MQLATFTIAAAVGSLTTLAFVAAAREAEPPLRIEVTIDDQVHLLTDGAKKSIEHKKRTFELGVRVAETRVFDAAGMRFEFPYDFRWSHDPDGPATFMVEGESSHVQLFVNEGLELAESDPRGENFVVEMFEMMLAEGQEIDEARLELGGSSYPATRGSATFFGSTLDVFVTCLAVGETSVIVLVQEFDSESGRGLSDEAEALLALLAESFEITADS